MQKNDNGGDDDDDDDDDGVDEEQRFLTLHLLSCVIGTVMHTYGGPELMFEKEKCKRIETTKKWLAQLSLSLSQSNTLLGS